MKSRRPVGGRRSRPDVPHERDALSDGAAALARRPLTESELRARLAERGHAAEEVEDAIGDLVRRGVLDDRELARHWCVVRAERRGHGPLRLLRDLAARGVHPEVARAALDEAIEDGTVDPVADLRRATDRRMRTAGPARDRRAYARVYNALLRAGFEPASIHEALAPHFSESGEDPADVPAGAETEDHDLE